MHFSEVEHDSDPGITEQMQDGMWQCWNLNFISSRLVPQYPKMEDMTVYSSHSSSFEDSTYI